jgi:hypothetical protein
MSSAALSVAAPPRPRQNWVVSPGWDLGTIIAAPLLWILVFGLLLPVVGAEALLTFFLVFNIAHHVPTFLRIYGDRDLLQRFRWNILLAPIIPFSFIFLGTLYLLLNHQPKGIITNLFIILLLWDPWHFLMQEYGFVRIYDRANAAPRNLAAWMDFTLCTTWFVYIMLEAVNWFPEKLYELYCNIGIPLLFWFDSGMYRGLELVALAAALMATAGYLVYLGWCRSRGYWISGAKLGFIVLSFGTLYLAYVPNAAMQRLVPEWDFTLGFAAIGMVHVTQYLAIVWTYNRNLSRRQGACRPGLFHHLFSRGGLDVAAGYVALCAAYGALLAFSFRSAPDERHVFVALVAAASFTSTLMHYYYDGFIWKIRHKENQQYLDLRKENEPGAQPALSWWEAFRTQPALAVAGRHLLYFGLPLALLSLGIGMVQADPQRNASARRVLELQQLGRISESIREAEAVRALLEADLQVERHMIALRPTAAHCAFAAELVHRRSDVQVYIDRFQPGDTDARARARRQDILESIQLMEQALALGGKVANRGFPSFTAAQAQERLRQWRHEAGLEPAPAQAERAIP